MIKIIAALFLGLLLYTLSLVITSIVTKDKIKTVFLGNRNGKEYFRFKFFNINIVITSWFFITSCVETHSNISKQKYVLKVILSGIISLFMLYICTFSVNIANNINNNSPIIVNQTNECVIRNIKSVKSIIIDNSKINKAKSPIHDEKFFDIFFQITFFLIMFNLLYNALRLFLSDKILFYSVIVLFVLLITHDILSIR